jgi:hypothetical protein
MGIQNRWGIRLKVKSIYDVMKGHKFYVSGIF